MPKFLVEAECQSCAHEHNQVIECENTSGPDDEDMNNALVEGKPVECPSCGDVAWSVMGYEEVKDAAADT